MSSSRTSTGLPLRPARFSLEWAPGMSEEPVERLRAYVECDGSARAGLFTDFVTALKHVARTEGKARAAEWARRAVSPDLDYTSLLAFRKFLGQPDASLNGNRLRLAVLGGPT